MRWLPLVLTVAVACSDDPERADPCDACTEGQVCIDGECRLVCNSQEACEPLQLSCRAGVCVAPECGNGVVEYGELCDGNCPTECNGSTCMSAELLGNAAACVSVCNYTPISTCVPGDQCCPPACTFATDADCPDPGLCGNGTIDTGETCDGDCPTACTDGDACTSDFLVGDPSACTSECSFVPITTCGEADGCCPTGCDGFRDDDCSFVVGNLIVRGDMGDAFDSSTYLPSVGYYPERVTAQNASLELTTDEAHQGSRSLAVTAAATGEVSIGGVSFVDAITLYAIRYRLVFWALVPNGTYSELRVRSVGVDERSWCTVAAEADNWSRVECDIELLGDEASVFDIVAIGGQGDDVFYLDDLSFGPLVRAVSETEMITDGGCESALPTIDDTAFSTYDCTAASSISRSFTGIGSCAITQDAGIPEMFLFYAPGFPEVELSHGWYYIGAQAFLPSSQEWRQSDQTLVVSDPVYRRMNLGHFAPLDTWFAREALIYVDDATSIVWGYRGYDNADGGGSTLYLDELTLRPATVD